MRTGKSQARGARGVVCAAWASLLLAASTLSIARAQEGIGALGEAINVQRDALARPELQPAQPSFMGCSVVVLPPTNNDFEQQVVELVNDHRASIGKPPLKRVPLLDQTARYHSCDMRDDDYFNHDTYDRVNGQLMQVCDFSQRVGGHYTNRATLGENIAAGYATPASVMQGWLNSPGHRGNIEHHWFWEIGVGYCGGGSWWHYWTQNFGRRFGVYPLVIQREYSRTATPQVEIYIYGNWQQMRLRNDNDPWGAWRPFANSLSWQLNWVQGVRQVCAELQSGSQTVTTCDTIELTTSEPPPSLSVQPAQVNFLYVRSTGERFPQVALLNVTNGGNSQTLNWQAGASPAWLSVTPATGNTPNPNVQLALNPAHLPNATGTYVGTVQFSATNANTNATVSVSLRVVDSLPHRRFAPLVRR